MAYHVTRRTENIFAEARPSDKINVCYFAIHTRSQSRSSSGNNQRQPDRQKESIQNLKFVIMLPFRQTHFSKFQSVESDSQRRVVGTNLARAMALWKWHYLREFFFYVFYLCEKTLVSKHESFSFWLLSWSWTERSCELKICNNWFFMVYLFPFWGRILFAIEFA